jgi:hypothetical protein
MKRLGIGTEGGLLIQCISSDSSNVRSALYAERSAYEGENGERLQSAQRVKELIGGHGTLSEDYSRLILKVDWETLPALAQRA